MIKYFCDVCGKEIPENKAGKRLVSKWGNLTTEIIVAFDGKWNKGYVCDECVLECVNSRNKESESQA